MSASSQDLLNMLFGGQQQNSFFGSGGSGSGGGGGGFPAIPFRNDFVAGNGPSGQEGGFGGFFGKMGDIFGGEKFGKAVGGFSALANLYGGFKSLGLAKDQFGFQKDVFNKNYAAQRKDYENTLKDRWTARNASAASRGQSFQSMDQWVGARNISA